MEERDSLKTLAHKSRAPLGTCRRVGIQAWIIEERAGNGCTGSEGTGRGETGGKGEGDVAGVGVADAVGEGALSGGALAGESLGEGTQVQRSFRCDGGRGTPCGPGLRQWPLFPGRQLEQGLPALMQAHLLHVPDLLQRQQALPRDPEVDGGGGGGGGDRNTAIH